MMNSLPVVPVESPLSSVVVRFAVVGFAVVGLAVVGFAVVVEVVSTSVVSPVVPVGPVVAGLVPVVSAAGSGPQARAQARAVQKTRRQSWEATPPKISQNCRAKI
ncbi:hypothetical protein [Nannocystis punicea]|uniref:Uncharacterized protein n=1 Tax=Nannocystis punicea TaxID=2995304 RepID=A0ABY7H7X2_9BACT|nr:hypothetical protein [Nannocystis poenicansa]WAS95363.1 hypothetical protein O0S08_04315 [Nannocystis poenicansa]